MLQRKDEVMNNRATFGTLGKFVQLTADLIPGVIGKNEQAGAEYQHHDSIPEEVLKLLKLMAVYVEPFREEFAGCGLLGVTEEQRKIKTKHSMS